MDAASGVTQERIRAVRDVIQPYVRRTPTIEVDGRELGLSSCTLVLKLELLQHAGSFKTRGAFANLLTRPIPPAGVIAASGGNHGAAVAYAAQRLGAPATIFVPGIASPAKIARIRQYGAKLIIAGERYSDALAESERWAAISGGLPLHAYDEPATLAGQGTIGLEFEEQAPELDSMLIAVGGGGLLGGIAAWHRGRVRVIGVEPEEAPTLTYALRAGRPVDAPAGGIAADSLAPKQIGQLVFPIAQTFVSQALLVTDEAITDAQRMLWDLIRIATEPGGAAAFSALLSGRYRPEPGERVGVLICGGNTTAVSFGVVAAVEPRPVAAGCGEHDQ